MYDEKKAHYICVTGIIHKDGKFLITKRASDQVAFPNRWTVPGGKLEVHDYTNREKDTPDCWINVCEDVLKREVKEETNFDVKNIRYVSSLVYMRKDNIPTLTISLLADYAGGELKLDPCLSEHTWVTAEEAKAFDCIGSLHAELDMASKRL